LALQVFLLVTWAWDISDCILGKIYAIEGGKTDENDSKTIDKCMIGGYQSVLVFATFFLIASTIVLWGLMFKWFGKSGCQLNLTLISLTIVAVVFLNLVSIAAKHGSIFVTSVVCLYGTYLCYAGMQSKADPSCNAFPGKRDTLSLWIGVIITAITSCYTGYSVAGQVMRRSADEKREKQEQDEGVAINVKNDTDGDTNGDKNAKGDANGDGNADVDNNANGNVSTKSNRKVEKSNYDDLEEDKKSPKKSEEEAEKRHNVIFHTCMALASIYVAMLYTNWATDSSVSHTENGREMISLVVNITGEWLSFFLYVWTLLAPAMCRNRDFSDLY